tara:strand:- start:84 stop:1136 length:1053 start_codon:yes stop_codon:yes gene_type:complete
MALIGNPIDFDRIRQRYDSITYPESRRTFGNDVLNMPTLQSGFGNVRTADFRDYNNDGIDDRDQGINIPNPNVKEYFPGTPVPSGLLSNTQSGTVRQDATQPGQQIQFITDPLTGRTEMIIPEYMGTYRTDQTNFFPGSNVFESIYSTGDSEIDPTTGRLRETTEEPMPIQTLPNVLSGGRSGDDPRGSFGFGKLGDTFTPAGETVRPDGTIRPGLGYAYDQYGRIRNIGKPRDMLVNTFDAMKPVTSSIGDFIKSGGIVGKVVDAVKEFSLSDLISNIGGGNDDDTTSVGIGGFTKEDETRESFRGGGTGGSTGASTRSGKGQDTSGRGQQGGARGGDNPGNTGGTSRF